MKNLIDIICEKLKVGAKTKVDNKTPYIKDFSDYIEKNNPFGKPISEVNNKIQIGKCYNINYNDPGDVIYAFPFYITMDERHWLGIYLSYRQNEQEDICRLSYVLGNIWKEKNQLRLVKLISHIKIEDSNENIDFEKYINTIKKLYNASKRMHPNDFLSKYEKIIDENNK